MWGISLLNLVLASGVNCSRREGRAGAPPTLRAANHLGSRTFPQCVLIEAARGSVLISGENFPPQFLPEGCEASLV